MMKMWFKSSLLFFSFCGKITHLSTEPADNGTFRAFITFDHIQSVETALVVDGTNLNGSIIHTELAPLTSIPVQTEVINNTESDLPPVIQSMSVVMSNLVAGGYKLSQEALNKAKTFDEQHKITEKLKDTTSKVQNKVEQIGEQIDEKLQITEKFNDLKTTVQTKYKEVEEKLDLNNKTKQIGETTTLVIQNLQTTVTTNVQSIGSDVEQFIDNHETLKNGVNQAKQWTQFLWSKTGEVVGNIGNMINEKTQGNTQTNQETTSE